MQGLFPISLCIAHFFCTLARAQLKHGPYLLLNLNTYLVDPHLGHTYALITKESEL